MIQPSAQLRQQQLRPRPLDETTLAALRSDLFGRYLHEVEVDCACDGPDQLTRELTEFANAVMALNQSFSFSGQSNCQASTAGSQALDSSDVINEASTAAASASTITQSPCD